MSDFEEIARWSLIRKWLSERIAAARRDDVAPQILPVGTRIPVTLDGELAGTVSIPKPRVTVSITDPGKFLAWVADRRPDEVETVRQVRASFTEAMRREVREHGGWMNRETGEVEPVPGMEAEQGTPTVSVSLAVEAEYAIARAWRNGDIDPGTLLALPGGSDD